MDIAIVAVFLVVFMGVGLFFGRKEGRSALEFFLAGDQLPWFLIGTSFVASSINTEQMIGTVGMAYRHGMPIVNWEWITLPIYTFMLVFFIPIFLRNRIPTVPEFLHQRFGPKLRTTYAFLIVLGYIFINLATVLYSGGLILSTVFGLPWLTFPVAVTFLILFTGAYTMYGGLKAVVWTDFIQCFVLILGGALVFFFGLREIPGGWGGMMDILRVDDPTRTHLIQSIDHPIIPWPTLIVGCLTIWIWYQVANQFMIQRVLGAKSEWDGKMGIIAAGIINFARPFATCFTGIVVFALALSHPDFIPLKATLDAKPDLAFTMVLEKLAPVGIKGIVVAGLLGAIMSTMDSLVNSISTVVALDLYKPLIKPKAEDLEVIRVGRIAGISVLVFAGLWCPMVGKFGGIFEYFQISLLALATPTMVVFWMAIFWKRATKEAALTTLLAGIPLYVIPVLLLRANQIEFAFLYVAGMVSILLVGIMVWISLLTQPPREDEVKPYIWNLKMIGLPEGQKTHWGRSLYLWYGVYAGVWLAIYITFW